MCHKVQITQAQGRQLYRAHGEVLALRRAHSHWLQFATRIQEEARRAEAEIVGMLKGLGLPEDLLSRDFEIEFDDEATPLVSVTWEDPNE